MSGFWEKLKDVETMIGFEISRDDFFSGMTGEVDGSTEDSSTEPDNDVVRDQSVNKPVVDGSAIDEPVINEPVIDEPVVNEPAIDEPVVNEPVID